MSLVVRLARSLRTSTRRVPAALAARGAVGPPRRGPQEDRSSRAGCFHCVNAVQVTPPSSAVGRCAGQRRVVEGHMRTGMVGARVCRPGWAIAVAVVALTLGLAAPAFAGDDGYIGTLTPSLVTAPTATGAVNVQGDYSVTHSCSSPPTGPFTYCGYFLTISTVLQGARPFPIPLGGFSRASTTMTKGRFPSRAMSRGTNTQRQRHRR